jgi:quinolinate synthase
MKLVTLEKIVAALETEGPEVTVPESVRTAAEKSIRAMLEIK